MGHQLADRVATGRLRPAALVVRTRTSGRRLGADNHGPVQFSALAGTVVQSHVLGLPVVPHHHVAVRPPVPEREPPVGAELVQPLQEVSLLVGLLVSLSRGRTTIYKKPVCVVPKRIAPGLGA